MTPARIQRQRTKGWRMPEGAIYVGRPTRWGNSLASDQRPWWWTESFGGQLHYSDPNAVLVEGYRVLACDQLTADPSWLGPLRGHDLACWCPLDQPCHADVLLELANA